MQARLHHHALFTDGISTILQCVLIADAFNSDVTTDIAFRFRANYLTDIF